MKYLPTATPELVGISSSDIERFIKAADERLHLHSFMLVRHGKAVARAFWKPYNPETTHMLYSLSKSFTSTAIGLLEAEGRLSLDDRLVDFFADKLPASISDNMREIRIRDMLAMTTGMESDPMEIWHEVKGLVDIYLRTEVKYKPGKHFMYSSFASYMLSAIVTRVTGQKLFDYLKPRLIDPLGIEGSYWSECPDGINMGGWGYNLKTEDIAKFGLLYLNDGVWQGRRLLPKGWVAKATMAHSVDAESPNPDWRQGYCYQFWRNRPCGYRADGMYGQFCLVLPEYDAVIAITAGEANTQLLLDTVWDILLPAMRPCELPENPDALESLNATIGSLTHKVAQGAQSSELERKLDGKRLALKSDLLSKSAFNITFDAERCKLTSADGRLCMVFGRRDWLPFETSLIFEGYTKCAGRLCWDGDTLQLCVSLYETPYTYVLKLKTGRGELEAGFFPEYWKCGSRTIECAIE